MSSPMYVPCYVVLSPCSTSRNHASGDSLIFESENLVARVPNASASSSCADRLYARKCKPCQKLSRFSCLSASSSTFFDGGAQPLLVLRSGSPEGTAFFTPGIFAEKSGGKKKSGGFGFGFPKLPRVPGRRLRSSPPVEIGVVSPELPVPPTIQLPPYARPGGKLRKLMGLGRGIDIKGASAIAKMRKSGDLAARVLAHAGSLVKAGVTTDELDRAVHDMIIANGAYPSPLNYDGFPKSVCTSVNEVVCHGIPDSRPLEEGDIVNIDVTVYLNGFHGDTNATFFVGQVDDNSRRLVETTREALNAAIAICAPGVPFSKIGHVISTIAEREGFGVVEEYCGHGIGQEFHTEPTVFHCRNDYKAVMQPGMTFTIEPMLNEGASGTNLLDDNWTVITRDFGRSAQFEHTLLITPDGVEVLTRLQEDSEAPAPSVEATTATVS